MAITGNSFLPGGIQIGGGSPNKLQKRGKEIEGEKRRRLKVAVVRRNKIPRVGQTIHDTGEPTPTCSPNHRLRLQKAAWRHTDTCYALLKYWIITWILPTWKSYPFLIPISRISIVHLFFYYLFTFKNWNTLLLFFFFFIFRIFQFTHHLKH